MEIPSQNHMLGNILLPHAGVSDAISDFPGPWGHWLFMELIAVGASREPGEDAWDQFGLARNGEAASFVDGQWLGVLHLCDEGVRPGDLSRRRHQFELFDLEADPEAATDVSEANLQTSKELHAKIAEWLGNARPKDWGGSELSGAALEAELAGMGYSGADDAPESYDPACTCVECARW